MRLERLRGRKICDRVLRKGSVWKGRTMLVRWLPGAPRFPGVDPRKPGIYCGTLASSKLSKSAVERNRMRRRCREAFRTIVREEATVPTVQLLVCPRSSSLREPFPLLQEDVKVFLSLLRASCPIKSPLPSSSSSS